jgi:hypothetical protein
MTAIELFGNSEQLPITPATDPTLCRGLAFLRAHAVMLRARQLWPA